MLKHFGLILLLIFINVAGTFAQSNQHIEVSLHTDTNTLNIQQDVTFHNKTNDTLNSIYLYDWNNAYSTKKSELARRFAEEFDRSLHLAKKDERGSTKIISITDKNFGYLDWNRTEPDIIRIQLKFPLYPDQNYSLKLSYTIKLPSAKFTGYGFTAEQDYNLRYWYIMPALYDGEWKLYNNKNLDDMGSDPTDYIIDFQIPREYKLISDLNTDSTEEINDIKKIQLSGKNRSDIKLQINRRNNFSLYQRKDITLISDIEEKNLNNIDKAASVDRIIDFVNGYLGPYPHKKLLVTSNDYKRNPLYGINQLPSFLRPFKEDFQFELKLLKTYLNNYLENTLFIDPRTEKWIYDGIQTFAMMQYVDRYYPNMKLLGSLSDSFLLRSFHLAQMNFNDQYPFLYMLVARKEIDQPLNQERDSLTKFNEKIANKYKAGLGLEYLNSYLGNHYINDKIKEFYQKSVASPVSPPSFKDILQEDSPKSINWFFDEYVNSRKRIDYKITSTIKSNDSIWVTVKNKRGTNVPITLFGVDRYDSIVSKNWLTDIEDEKTFRIENNDTKRLILNYDKIIPEFNQRDNWKSTNGFFSSNKRLKLQFMKDAENPYYNQLFYVPVFRYNLYDGFTPGIRLANKTLLNRPLLFNLEPSYALKAKALVGSGSVTYRDYIENENLYLISYYLSGSSFHYTRDLRYSTITPAVNFYFRSNDFRSNERESLSLRFVNVMRDKDPLIKTDPDYSIFNARYLYSNSGIINHLTWFSDVQIASKFSKVALNVEYRKLFQNNTQLNLRFFAGKFIYNETNSDFFSFALDRPTDYLFDYDYLGRSESTGLFSQQLIIAEGGFKSKLNHPYANNWMATTNASINIWRWIELYGDIGMIKNNFEGTRYVYDSGLRLNLVTDYFELYLPFYSNNGWEISQPHYDQKIRFIITLSPRTLTGLFTRKWF